MLSTAREKSSNDKIIKRKNQYPFPPTLCSGGWGEEGSEGLKTLINVWSGPLLTCTHTNTHTIAYFILDVINSQCSLVSGCLCIIAPHFSTRPCVFSRGVWRGVQRPPEDARQEGDLRGHQDAEGRLHRQAEEGLPVRGQHHGPVRPPQHHSPRGRGHQM